MDKTGLDIIISSDEHKVFSLIEKGSFIHEAKIAKNAFCNKYNTHLCETPIIYGNVKSIINKFWVGNIGFTWNHEFDTKAIQNI